MKEDLKKLNEICDKYVQKHNEEFDAYFPDDTFEKVKPSDLDSFLESIPIYGGEKPEYRVLDVMDVAENEVLLCREIAFNEIDFKSYDLLMRIRNEEGEFLKKANIELYFYYEQYFLLEENKIYQSEFRLSSVEFDGVISRTYNLIPKISSIDSMVKIDKSKVGKTINFSHVGNLSD